MKNGPSFSALYLMLERPEAHSASSLVNSPHLVRKVSRALMMMTPLLLLLLLLPWQQAALGIGQVTALSMQQREQAIDASVYGTIERWYVQEGQFVEEGELLVALRDNDPQLLGRLTATEQMGASQVDNLSLQVRSYQNKLRSERASRDLKVAEAAAKVSSLRSKRVGLSAIATGETTQARRIQTLAQEGISSTRQADVASMKADKATASVAAINNEIEAAEHAQNKAGAAGDAKVAAVQGELEAAKAKLSAQQQKQLALKVKVNRQQAQFVRAPRDGTILRLHGGPGGAQVKPGDVLITLVPATTKRAVEIWVDGNDMPLIGQGEQVRLLFEGWPALQMVGFPGADAGTYAGKVAFIDATDDGKGNFRVVVVPDEGAHAWPDAKRLRQGVRAKGWVLLGRVSLGYELWRRINGFPSLPPVDKGGTPLLPSSKKPKAPKALK